MQAPAHHTKAQRTFLMRAAIVHSEKAILPAEDANLVVTRHHYPEAALLEIRDRTNVDHHLADCTTAAGLFSSSAFHP